MNVCPETCSSHPAALDTILDNCPRVTPSSGGKCYRDTTEHSPASKTLNIYVKGRAGLHIALERYVHATTVAVAEGSDAGVLVAPGTVVLVALGTGVLVEPAGAVAVGIARLPARWWGGRCGLCGSCRTRVDQHARQSTGSIGRAMPIQNTAIRSL